MTIRPKTLRQKPVRATVQLKTATHQALKQLAAEDRRTLMDYMAVVLEAHVARKEPSNA